MAKSIRVYGAKLPLSVLETGDPLPLLEDVQEGVFLEGEWTPFQVDMGEPEIDEETEEVFIKAFVWFHD